jgi:hypothetical protein
VDFAGKDRQRADLAAAGRERLIIDTMAVEHPANAVRMQLLFSIVCMGGDHDLVSVVDGGVNPCYIR